MAQAMPVVDRVTFSFFSVAGSPWNSASPILTCSMNSSSNVFITASCCSTLVRLRLRLGAARLGEPRHAAQAAADREDRPD